jgi:hypothetical protein
MSKQLINQLPMYLLNQDDGSLVDRYETGQIRPRNIIRRFSDGFTGCR